MKRLKEQLQIYSVESLSTSELLALVLSCVSTRKDMVSLASNILEKYGKRDLRKISESELVKEGLTRAGAQLLNVVCELAGRLSIPLPHECPQIVTADAAAALLRPFLSLLDSEAFCVLVLDGKKRLLANIQVYKGTANGPALVVAHNHPSLDPAPSLEIMRLRGTLLMRAILLV